MMRRGRRKGWMVGAAAAVAVAAIAYAVVPALGPDDAVDAAPDTPAVELDRATVRGERLPGDLLVRAIDKLAPFGDGPVYALTPAGATRRAGSLECKQLHAAPDGTGLCLRLAPNGLDYEAAVFDADYRVTRRFPIEGVPFRARVSRDGRYGAYTTFDDESSIGYFASASAFTTFTRIVDMRSGKTLVELEDLKVIHRGRELPSTDDENFWGVTFADDGRFFATGAVLGGYYLLEGRVGGGSVRTRRPHVECPSLSPDGTRIAYKRRIGSETRWRLHVLDLATGRDVALADRRSIDDQPEWLDDERIVYSDDRSVFAVPADGRGQPVKLAGGATSPASPDRGGR